MRVVGHATVSSFLCFGLEKPLIALVGRLVGGVLPVGGRVSSDPKDDELDVGLDWTEVGPSAGVKSFKLD